MEKRRTNLLILLLLTAMASVVLAYGRFDHQRDSASAAARDLELCQKHLGELSAAKNSPGGLAPVSTDLAELNRRIRGATQGAQIADDQWISIESGQPSPIANTDYQEFPVFVSYQHVSMKQLLTFLSELSQRDLGSRAKTIELQAETPDDATEHWRADMTITYLLYAPRKQ